MPGNREGCRAFCLVGNGGFRDTSRPKWRPFRADLGCSQGARADTPFLAVALFRFPGFAIGYGRLGGTGVVVGTR